ncbi:hypothetical protein BV22DRAFT_1082819 [Leucogyrophana mollusca]|uniref:Uncharacterized protein n=1 Tax=Leucogyrophana mollusca TaxID=85980 RepID=A0ACB8BT04_9AGAM|nr:hypothetical protein BV22DRAFT_1082819 [Leucogyrophana mollusca]
MPRTSHAPSMRAFLVLCLLFGSFLFLGVSAQSTSTNTTSPSPTVSPNVTVVLTTSSFTTTSVSHSGNREATITEVLPTVINATETLSPSPTSSTSPSPTPIVLETKITPAFGVLGAILILTGLPSAFWGHKNRWTSFFLIGFYTLSLVCFVLIIKFGILPAINPPSLTLQGMFVLASVIAGILGGGITIFFWKGTKYFIGAWGGFAFGLWVQCFKDGGLVPSVGLRWILYIACSVVGFVLCTIPKLHWHMVLVATAFVGSSAFILGVDCYTTAGLKEFYIWNLGFTDLFPKYTSNGIAFPVNQTMEIELGLIGAIALMGGAVQLRILRVLQRKLREIKEEQKKRDEEAELDASDRLADISKEQEEWERDHPSHGKHIRNGSGYSGTPLMKEFPTSGSNEARSSTFTLVGDRRRYQSGVSEFMAAPTPDEEIGRVVRNAQSPGALPALDLGLGIQDDVPSSFITKGEESDTKKADTSSELDALARKEELLAEIQTIRRSIDALRSETPGIDSDDSRSRRISMTSRRTLSYDLDNAIAPRPHLRPPRGPDPRNRAQSMELSKLSETASLGASIGRPTSVPLREDGWDSYVRDRKLLQPPSGVTAPIPTTPVTPTMSSRLPVSQAVTEALAQRKRRESILEMSGDTSGIDTTPKDTSDEDVPIAALAPVPRAHTRKPRARPTSNIPAVLLAQPAPAPAPAPTSNIPIVLPRPKPTKPVAPPEPPSNLPIILPRSMSTNIVAPVPQRPEVQRTVTVEELEERHREKMRGMQAPLTQAEKEHAEIEAAKNRWERSRAVEKEQVARRQAEKAAQVAAREEKNKRQSVDGLGKRNSTLLDAGKTGERPPPGALSADKLAAIANNSASSKRQSMMRVEDWQRYQQDTELGVKPDRGSGSKRDSRASATVPFPGQSRPRDAMQDRRRSSGLPRDPPS